MFRIREKSVNQISVFILRGGIIIIGRDTSKLVQMADGSFVRKRLE